MYEELLEKSHKEGNNYPPGTPSKQGLMELAMYLRLQEGEKVVAPSASPSISCSGVSEANSSVGQKLHAMPTKVTLINEGKKHEVKELLCSNKHRRIHSTFHIITNHTLHKH